MPIPWLAAATALGAGASIFGARESSSAQQAVNETNREIAERNIAFQREGMQNRHQWEVDDLIKAGLNPILSAGGGGPIGMGSSAHMENPKPHRGELYLSTAKAIADTMLTREMANTEKTKQELNREEANAVRTRLPGVVPFTNMPLSDISRRIGAGFSSAGSLAREFGNYVRKPTFSFNPKRKY